MKERWQQLNESEKRTTVIGVFFVIIILSYFILFRPLFNRIHTLQNEIPQQQDLLNWMEPAAKQIQNLRSHQTIKTTQLALLPQIEQSLKNMDLNKQVTELSQMETNKVSVNFKQVAFDKLIIWLDTLWKKYGIKADEISVTPKMPTGYVEATLVVTLAK